MADENSIVFKNIPPALNRAFRKKARKRYGDKKGSIREAAIEAMRMFNEGTLGD